MRLIETNKKFASDEEYFAFEEASELKHELINGNLYEMSGASRYHNKMERLLANFIEALITTGNYEVFTEGFKVRTPEANYFYPDICVCKADAKKYYTDEPILLIEVLSENTRKYDLTDKFIQYQKIPTLQYYLCVEPEQQAIVFYFKSENGEWLAETFTKDESIIQLPALGISFSLKDVYGQ